ncbi:hypothetical protein BDV24DRAFT_121998 [Aspergillus arachidicola]|uniref:Uncharacterized protein n=1 Tax=Aspergillus arachidicola TaxID=656916 RepID=A0A5N6YR85_9EURO|nr:hypothetical protein BDV24DRAFT_121998 [Aspergillus arachidicola]
MPSLVPGGQSTCWSVLSAFMKQTLCGKVYSKQSFSESCQACNFQCPIDETESPVVLEAPSCWTVCLSIEYISSNISPGTHHTK